MAELHVQRKRNRYWWLWLLLVIIIAAATYIYMNYYRKNNNVAVHSAGIITANPPGNFTMDAASARQALLPG